MHPPSQHHGDAAAPRVRAGLPGFASVPPSCSLGQVKAAGAAKGRAEGNLNNNKGKIKKREKEKNKKPQQASRCTEVIRGTEQIIGEANNAF